METTSTTRDSGGSPDQGQPPRRRAWWQWVLGVGLLGTAVVSTMIRSIPGLHPGGGNYIVLRPVSVSDAFEPADSIPAAPGQLAGHNLLLVSLDTTRVDRLGCYGCLEARTPTLDYLASQGILFSNAVSPGSTTLPAHATMMTGLYPYHHGARANGMYRLDEEQRTLAEILSEAGYSTGAMISAPVLGSTFGLSQGFATYDQEFPDEFEARLHMGRERRAGKTTDAALAWLEGHKDGPFFMWVHYFDPHSPLKPPDEIASQFAEDRLYDAEIAFVDSQLARLVDALDEANLTEKTVVVVVADHGESQGQHGEATHGMFVYDETVRVPLIMRLGGVRGGLHIARQVQTVDIAPTVLSLLGLATPDWVDGVDLTQPESETRPAFIETFEGLLEFGWAAPIGVRQYPLKYIHGSAPELYDLVEDPFETENLIESRREDGESLFAKLKAFYGDDLEGPADIPVTPVASEEEIEQLAALGYVQGVDELPAPEDRPDPHKMLAVKLEAERLLIDAEAEDTLPQAAEEMEAIVAEHPRAPGMWRFLGECYAKLERYDEASRAFEKCLELQPNAPYVLGAYARVCRAKGEVKKAEELYRATIKHYPAQKDAVELLGKLLFRQQRIEEAAELLTTGFQRHPTEVLILDGLETALTRLGRTDRLLEVWKEALSKSPTLHLVRSRLAGHLNLLGQRDQALELLREGVRLYPDHWDLANNLALILTKPGVQLERPELFEAIRLMEGVCRQTGFKDLRYMQTLAEAYKAAFRVEEALAVLQRARGLVEESDEATVGEQISVQISFLKELSAQGVSPLHPPKRSGSPAQPPSETDEQVRR